MRILSAVIHLPEAKTQVLESRGPELSSRQFLHTYIALATSEWSFLERIERLEVTINVFKTLRILTEDKIAVNTVTKDYPLILSDIRELIQDN